MNPQSNITFEKANEGEYPPGEEWRGKLREAMTLLGTLDDDGWVKLYPIEQEIVNRVRAAAHAIVSQWENDPWQSSDDKYKLITRYDPGTQVFWMSVQTVKKNDKEEDEA
jgi:hypothetical protein